MVGLGVLDMPGVGFGSWFSSMISNLLVYPVVGAILLLSLVFLGQSLPGFSENWNVIGPTVVAQQTSLIWLPPLTVGQSLFSFLWVFVSLALFSLVPKAAEMIKSIAAGKPFGYGTAIGQPLSAGWGVTSYLPRQTVGIINEGTRKALVTSITQRAQRGVVANILRGRQAEK